MKALGRILLATEAGFVGRAFYSDGEEIMVEKYDGLRKMYYCGREYKKPEPPSDYTTLLVVIDSKEAAIGLSNGERIRVLWTDTSLVWSKHGQGGQSQARFQRVREETIKQWLREVRDKLMHYFSGQPVVVGGAGMTKDSFIEELPQHIRDRITHVESVGYTDENGLWELIKKSRYE